MTHKVPWKVNDIIRHKATGKPYLVIHIYFQVGTMVADLEERNPVARMLFKRDYEDFATDRDMMLKEDKELEQIHWSFEPIPNVL